MSVAAARVVLQEILTPAEMDGAARLGRRLAHGCGDILIDRKIPGRVQYRGISGVLLFAPALGLDWHSFLGVDVGKWWAYYIAMMNRGVVPMAAGPDEQWTVSVQHTDDDVEAHLAAFDEVASALRAFKAEVPLVEAV